MSTTTDPPELLFDSDDLRRAHAEWGCSCGPAALAACLGLTLDAVRPHVMATDFAQKRHMSAADMKQAVESTGARCEPTTLALPMRGLARVQWGGPWLLPTVPFKARFRYTHWIATTVLSSAEIVAMPEFRVFDVNGGWKPLDQWQLEVVPAITKTVKRADGTYSLIDRWEVRR